VALPVLFAVIIMLLESTFLGFVDPIDTIVGLELVQVRVLLVAFAGKIVGVRVAVCFGPSIIVVGVRVIEVTGIMGRGTVTVQVAINPPSAAIAVMTALPLATAVTRPLLTVATDALLLDQRII
jgi:hypothetical protein